MSFKRFILDASDRQWPSPTQHQRSEYRARRAVIDRAPIPVWQWGLAFWALFVAIPFVYWLASA